MANEQATVTWSVEQGVGRITMNRPDAANAFNRQSARDLAVAIDHVLASPALRVVVLTGNGPMFCGGGDIAEFIEHPDDLPELVDDILSPLLKAFERLATATVPIVSVVNGPFGGAGIGLALVGDVVLAADNVKVRGGYAALGLSPDLGASWLLVRRVGAARANQVFLLNRPLDAATCLAWGLVDEVYPRAELAAAAEKVIAQLAAGAAQSQARIKRLVAAATRNTIAEHLQLERDSLIACAGTADAKEGVRAFIEKRPARFGA